MSFFLPVRPASTNKSIRFPNPLVEEIERAIRGSNCTFTAFVLAACRAALERLEESE